MLKTAKQERLATLRKLIASNKVGNQEDILEILSSMGHEITQATLSRDLKELKVAKTPDGVGGYHYKLPGNVPNAQPDKVNLGNDHTVSGVRSVEFSGQMCVVKTMPGYANMVASLLDMSLGHSLMGTIAGDDTLLVILREGTDAMHLISDMDKVLPGIAALLVH